ncbi:MULTISPECIES: signal peptidase II [unclassified Candidatus Frackibacter]|uniref:signal peptidase II n=1 Tax=unclassified Candidatus Frackibacter TaxID=2648818 RepID=UPI0008815F43|nr:MULTISPECIES: signal peptidase II [unclassified Candidatus Frackibacter]SDC48226.1 signal peptidase II [Candidatus Frackibacter sp. WG11]SEM95504.1 signal peptidase II [Candidatus Frackibacter sp. WG12]SFL73360.1 signal peptidase II [Candidatus Frackibacter sp. WG13]
MVVLITALLILVLDQVTKLTVVKHFYLGESLPIIDNIFHLTYVRNFGAAFGILNNQRLFFIITTSLVIIILLALYYKAKDAGLIIKIALGLGLGGAIGNLIDRVRLGYVIDFLDFRIWPVFNIADSAIVVGVGIFFYWAIILDGLDEMEE